MLLRAYEVYGGETPKNTAAPDYSDFDAVDDWARSSVATLSQWGVMNGSEEGSFSPQGLYTTEQCLVTFLRTDLTGRGGRSASYTYFVYQEGGINDRVHVLRAPAKTPGTLRMERGAYAGEFFPLYLAGERLFLPMRIEVRSPDGLPLLGKFYTVTGLVVKKWEAGELDALQNTILIDRFELNYEHMLVSPL